MGHFHEDEIEDLIESSLSVLRGLKFWIWDQEQHTQEHIRTNGLCCFNHVVELPQKDKKEYPLFDYEKILYDSLLSVDGSFKDKHLWIKKATGLGADDLGKLDKEATSYDNVLDAFRLLLQMFKLKEKERGTVLYATID